VELAAQGTVNLSIRSMFIRFSQTLMNTKYWEISLAALIKASRCKRDFITIRISPGTMETEITKDISH
jgi:hypothetical protein